MTLTSVAGLLLICALGIMCAVIAFAIEVTAVRMNANGPVKRRKFQLMAEIETMSDQELTNEQMIISLYAKFAGSGLFVSGINALSCL